MTISRQSNLRTTFMAVIVQQKLYAQVDVSQCNTTWARLPYTKVDTKSSRVGENGSGIVVWAAVCWILVFVSEWEKRVNSFAWQEPYHVDETQGQRSNAREKFLDCFFEGCHPMGERGCRHPKAAKNKTRGSLWHKIKRELLSFNVRTNCKHSNSE